MRGLLTRHLLRRYLVLVGAVLAGLLVVFLVADFVDRARAYTGPNWVRDVAELYGWKAMVAAHQLAPAALLLASATLVSLLRRRGELTAILALGFGRRVLFLPVAGVALVAAIVLGTAGRAGGGARQPPGGRDHRAPLPPLGRLAVASTSGSSGSGTRTASCTSRPVTWRTGFQGVTVLRLTPDFDLAERVRCPADGARRRTSWRLTGVTRRVFDRRGG